MISAWWLVGLAMFVNTAWWAWVRFYYEPKIRARHGKGVGR